MHVRDLLQDVEPCSDRIQDAANEQQEKARTRQRRVKHGQKPYDTPSEQQIQKRGGPPRTKDPERFDRHADERGRPDDAEQDEPSVVREGDQAERRVRSGDEQVDSAVVHDLEDALGAFVRERMVQRRGEVFEQHGYAEDDRGCKMRPSAVRHCGHDHDGNGGDGEQRADAVRDRVGDFLAQTVLTHRARRADGCSVAFASHVGILA